MKTLILTLTLFCSFCVGADPLLIGYYSNQAQYRPGAGSCLPIHLLPVTKRLDVLNYGFLHVNYKGVVKPAGPAHDGRIHFAEWNDEELIRELRQKNPELKILLSVQNISNTSPSKCEAFVDSLSSLAERLQIQGIDIQGENLLPLLQALKAVKPLLVTVAVHEAPAELLLSYVPYVDWINVLPSKNEQELIDCYLKAGVPAEKLVVGVASSGQCDPAFSGYYTKKPGSLAYFEIAHGLENGLFNESSLAYERPENAFCKGRLVLERQLRGALVMNLDTDNFMDPLSPFAITEALKEGLTP